MDLSELEDWSNRVAAWAAQYHGNIRDRPVRPELVPGKTYNSLPASAPDVGEPMSGIFADFERLIVPNMTHWQHPRFFAYFPANAAPASMIAEQLVTAMAAQCMLWQTSPAATELETRVLEWLRQALGLPAVFEGVIQDSASSATLAAVLTMRERALGFTGNSTGLFGRGPLRIYCSDQVHSSIDRAIWISGIGEENLIKIPTIGPNRGLDPAALQRAIASDRAAGFVPAGLIGCIGGTSIGASDDLRQILPIARAEGLYSHIDAAWAGSAMICPEFREIWAGVEQADSIVFNPHKWLGAQFDCSVQFLKDPESHVRTLAIQPEYLKTRGVDQIIDYSEWSVPLGRRFRALKLWFLIRAHGLSGLRAMIGNHVRWAREVCEAVRGMPGLEITSEPMLSLFSFACVTDQQTTALLEAINADGRIYLTRSRLNGRAIIRFQAGAWHMESKDAATAIKVIAELSAETI